MKDETLKTMSVQELCDYAIKKLVEQGKRSIDNSDNCLYKDCRGNKCAIGHLMLEDSEEAMKSGSDIYALIDEYPDSLPPAIKENVATFNILQDIHDVEGLSKPIYNQRAQAYGIDMSGAHWEQWREINQ